MSATLLGSASICLSSLLSTVKEAVNKKWVDKIASLIPLYKGLTFLTFENLEKGKIHPLFKVNCHTGKDISIWFGYGMFKR
jgi:cadmium resistance protein CadD (predicted permease)